jgi:hypothetical protein
LKLEEICVLLWSALKDAKSLHELVRVVDRRNKLFAGLQGNERQAILCLGWKPTCSVWALLILGLYRPFMLCSAYCG